METNKLFPEDEYIKDDGSDSEDEDGYELNEDDILILDLDNDTDQSTLNVHVLEDDKNLYLHHDILLPWFSLCVEWIGVDPQKKTKGSFAAVGGFSNEIEIWNLDIIDPMYATKTLKVPNENEAILDLSWNQKYKQFLASSGANSVINLWDITTDKITQSLNIHKDKVLKIEWHQQEANILLSGSYDKTCKLTDPSKKGLCQSYNTIGVTESIRWNPNAKEQFFIGLDDGTVMGYDFRQNKTPLYYFKAHEGSVNDISFHPLEKDLLITGGEDGFIKIWDTKKNKYQSSQRNAKPTEGKLDFEQDVCHEVYALNFGRDIIFYGGQRGGVTFSKKFSQMRIAEFREKPEEFLEKQKKKLETKQLKEKSKLEKEKKKLRRKKKRTTLAIEKEGSKK